jgi:hypothetical protein
MTNKNLEINILYFSRQGKEIIFSDITQKKDCLEISDYEPDNFWAIMGGFEITIGGHFTIFHSSDFHYLVKATSFLIHSMYWIKNQVSDWFDKDIEFPNDVVVKSTGGNIIRLICKNDSELSFSFSHISKDYRNVRGDRFFEEITINKYEWFKQVDIALDEYFSQLLNVIDKSEKPNSTNETMMEYYEVWTKIRH